MTHPKSPWSAVCENWVAGWGVVTPRTTAVRRPPFVSFAAHDLPSSSFAKLHDLAVPVTVATLSDARLIPFLSPSQFLEGVQALRAAPCTTHQIGRPSSVPG